MAKTSLTSRLNLAPSVFSFSSMAGFSPTAAILENEKTLGTRLQPTDAQGTYLKQLQLTGLPWLLLLLLLLLQYAL